MKICSRCGAPLAEDARFCGNCGTAVQDNTFHNYSQQEPPIYGQPNGNVQGTSYQQPGEYQNTQGGYYQNPYGTPGGQMYSPQPGSPVSSTLYLVFSILALLFCLPLGIPAIIFATKIDRANQEGRYLDAQKAANTCKILLIIAGALIAVTILLYIVSLFALAGAASTWYYY